ncbi:MAG: molybdate ABC transporter substrate-binding protein [Bacillota bacterium]
MIKPGRQPGLPALFSLALVFAALASLSCTIPGRKPAQVDLTLSAAASLGDVLNRVLPGFEQSHPGVRVHLNLGSSGALANQIRQGAPVDLFIAAGQSPMDDLVRGGQVDGAGVSTLAGNQIVLVVPASGGGAVAGWDDLRRDAVRHVAVGNPAHVPAGQYAEETLLTLGLWDLLQPKLVLGEDVRQTLQFVEAGEADAGLVYATDAATSQKVRVAAAAPPEAHKPVLYPLAVVRTSAHPREAQSLLDYLLGPETAEALRAAGFEVSR